MTNADNTSQKPQDSQQKPTIPFMSSRLLLLLVAALLIAGIAGTGGYWLGARRQQSLSTHLQTSPKPSSFPSATPVQHRSPTPTPIATSQIIPTPNWKTYTNADLGFSIDYPANVYLHREIWHDTKPPQKVWSVTWGNMEREKIKDAWDPNTTGIVWRDLYALGYYSVSVNVDKSPVALPPSSRAIEPITEKNLILLLGMGASESSRMTFQGRPAVRDETTAVYGHDLKDIGGHVDYYILDQRRVIHLQGQSYNIKKVPLSALDEILSTFKFTD